MTNCGLSSNKNGRCKRRLTKHSESTPHSEAVLRRRIVASLKRQFPSAYILHPSDRFVSGVPDLLCCLPNPRAGHRGIFLAIEVKLPGHHPTPIQCAMLLRIKDAGGLAWVIRSVKELNDVILP